MAGFELMLVSTWIITLVAFIALYFIPVTYKAFFTSIIILVNAGITGYFSFPALYADAVGCTVYSGSLMGSIPIRVDGLSVWFMLIVNFVCIMGSVYGTGYMKPYRDQKSNTSLHWGAFMVFHLSMLWVCMLQHSLMFLIVWEIMSLSSLLLVIFEHSKTETIKAGLNYFIQMHIGVVFLTLAFIQVYMTHHTFDFKAVALYFDNNPPFVMFLLFFIGFGIKAGFIPFHTWLPKAHPAAPSHVSGVMSGVIVKMGIYGILRIVSYMSNGLLFIGELLLVLSTLTAFYGILNASVHRDFKKMLAFCTIENIGIIGMGTAVGMIGKATGNQYIAIAGFAGAVLHTLNHSLFKSLLFFTAGNIYQVTHTRNMEQSGGLIKKIPFTAIAFLIGALAIGGLPPFNGFISEFLIYSGLIEGVKNNTIQFSVLMIMSVAGLAIVGGLSMLTFTKTFGVIFLGSPRHKPDHEPREVSGIMLVPLYVIISIMLTIGLFPAILLKPLQSVLGVFVNGLSTGSFFYSSFSTLSSIGIVSLVFILLAALIYLLKVTLTKKQVVATAPTWGCGYTGGNTRMQYTGKSFSKSLAKLFSFIAIEKKEYKEIEAHSLFPAAKTFKSNYLEFFEKVFIDRIIHLFLRFMYFFTFIQNGKTQMYVLYGFLFIIVIILATFLNLF